MQISQPVRSPLPDLPVERHRILLVSTNADLGGAPRHVHDLALGLAPHFDVHVAFGEDGPIRHRLRHAGISTHVIPGIRSNIDPVQDVRSTRALIALIQRIGQVRLLHAHSAKAGMVARLAARSAGLPVIYTVHGWGFGPGRSPRRAAVVRAIEWALRPLTTHYIMVSAADGRLGQETLGIPSDHYTVIHNAVPDRQNTASPETSTDLVMVARAEYPKDHELALRAFARTTGEATLTLVGGGTDDAGFVERARSWAGVRQDQVRFLGARDDIESLMAQAGVLVLLSRFEGLPLAVLEGMRAGLPVLASDVGGIPEIITDERNGILVPVGGLDEAARAMQRLIDDPQRRGVMGRRGRERFEAEISVTAMIRAVARVYASAGVEAISQS